MIIFETANQRLTPTYLVNWWDWSHDDNRTPNRHKFTGNKNTTGILSKASLKRMRTAIQILNHTSKSKKVYVRKTNSYFRFKINFITLTLPCKQKDSDKFIRRYMLERFLRWMRSKGANKYIWKAETQKNGNIHFHITTSLFIHHAEVRKQWNSICFANDYTNDKTDNPNSTDVHSVKNDKYIESYMVKYLSKSDETRRKVNCKIWDCSSNLKEKFPIITENIPDEEIHNFINQAEHKIEDTFYQVYCYNHNNLIHFPNLYRIWKEFCNQDKFKDKQIKEQLFIE